MGEKTTAQEVRIGKRPYRRPRILTAASQAPAVLLICTGQYNCVGEVGYDCCVASADECFTSC